MTDKCTWNQRGRATGGAGGANEAIAVRVTTPHEIRQAVAEGRLRHVLALSALSPAYDPFDRPKAGKAGR